MQSPIIIHASSFNGYVVINNERVIETIHTDSVVGTILHFCTITQEIIDEVNKKGFANLVGGSPMRFIL